MMLSITISSDAIFCFSTYFVGADVVTVLPFFHFSTMFRITFLSNSWLYHPQFIFSGFNPFPAMASPLLSNTLRLHYFKVAHYVSMYLWVFYIDYNMVYCV